MKKQKDNVESDQSESTLMRMGTPEGWVHYHRMHRQNIFEEDQHQCVKMKLSLKHIFGSYVMHRTNFFRSESTNWNRNHATIWRVHHVANLQKILQNTHLDRKYPFRPLQSGFKLRTYSIKPWHTCVIELWNIRLPKFTCSQNTSINIFWNGL